MLHVLYLVHDLSDPAVRRRVLMLLAGGAKVTLAGFRRGGAAPADVAGLRPIDLGPTHDARFAQRIGAVALAAAGLRKRLAGVEQPDLIIGRHMEMLALANRARRLFERPAPIVYESLDIHRLLLRGDVIGHAMRRTERFLASQAILLITSSPAFVREYFAARGQFDAEILLMENKFLELSEAPGRAAIPSPAPGEPWKIGWFGALRCRRSLRLLAEFSRRMNGRFEIVLRGRPAYGEIPDFDAFVEAEPYLRFEGPYRNPEDLATIYGEVHFAWAIDFFEDGLNSRWLLPNRLYEGCRFGTVPIAVDGTETARFLRSRDIGQVLSDPSVESLIAQFATLDPHSYAHQRAKVAAVDPATWVCDRPSCHAIVNHLRMLVQPPLGPTVEAR